MTSGESDGRPNPVRPTDRFTASPTPIQARLPVHPAESEYTRPVSMPPTNETRGSQPPLSLTKKLKHPLPPVPS